VNQRNPFWSGLFSASALATLAIVSGISFACVSAPPAPAAAAGRADPRLREVKTLFLGDFGTQEGGDLVREKIRNALEVWGRFRPIESTEGADAIVTGVAGFERNPRPVQASPGNISGGGEDYRGLAILRIVDARSRETLWRFEYRRHSGGDRSASSRVAIQFIDDLKKAVAVLDKAPGPAPELR